MESTSPEAFAYDCCLMGFFSTISCAPVVGGFFAIVLPSLPSCKRGRAKKALQYFECSATWTVTSDVWTFRAPRTRRKSGTSQCRKCFPRKYGAHSLRRRVFLRWIERLRWTRVIPPCRAGGREEASRGKFRTDRPGGPCRMRSLSASSYSARYGLVVVGRVVVTGGGWRHEGGRRRGGIN